LAALKERHTIAIVTICDEVGAAAARRQASADQYQSNA
jgi:hypothetical protein